MIPIKFYVVPRKVVETLTWAYPLPSEYLQNYLAARPGILDDGQLDIFNHNVRSNRQAWTAFGLFQQVDSADAADVVVFPFWLELFLSGGVRRNIAHCIEWALSAFPKQPVVFHYNHDIDCATMPEFQNLPSRAFVIQFNTSKPTSNDILVPFWAIETNLPVVEKRHKAGFVGYVGSIEVRARLAKAIRGRNGYYFDRERMSENEWLRLVGSFQFSLCPRGAGLSSYRFFESIQCGSIPVLFADAAVLPYPWFDYDQICVRIPESDAGDFCIIEQRLDTCDWKAMTEKVIKFRKSFSLAGVQSEIYGRLNAFLQSQEQLS